MNIFATLDSLRATVGKLLASLATPATTRIPPTNAEIKALRQAAIDNQPLDRNMVLRVCGSALDGRKRNRRYAGAMREVLTVAG